MTEIGELEATTRLTIVRRLCGQESMSPTGVLDQSFDFDQLAHLAAAGEPVDDGLLGSDVLFIRPPPSRTAFLLLRRNAQRRNCGADLSLVEGQRLDDRTGEGKR